MTTADLSEKKCVPCEGGTPPLTTTEAEQLHKEIDSAWVVVPPTSQSAMKLKREFTFKNFKNAMNFVNEVATIAEAEGHHPDISIFYNKVTIELWTHAVMGLSENDFIVAAKIDKISK